MRIYLKILSVFVASLAFSGCVGGANDSDLENYIREVKEKPEGVIDPLPTFTSYQSHTYKASVRRSPFDRPVDLVHRVFGRTGDDIKPDLNREKEYLEKYDLGELKMVGSIKKRGTLWALIADPTGFVTTVTSGNYIGANHGKIITTSNTQVELLEIVSNGLDGWVERPRVLVVTEKD